MSLVVWLFTTWVSFGSLGPFCFADHIFSRGQWSAQASLYRLGPDGWWWWWGGLLIWGFQRLIRSKSLLKSLSLDSLISRLSSLQEPGSFWGCWSLIKLFHISSWILLQQVHWTPTPHLDPIADKSTQLCGTQRLGFSCQAEARVGWGGLLPGWKFLLFLSQHRFQTHQNNPPPPNSSPPQATWPDCHHFYAGNAVRSGVAWWCGGRSLCW